MLKDFILYTNVISMAPFTKISQLAIFMAYRIMIKYSRDLKTIKDSLFNSYMTSLLLLLLKIHSSITILAMALKVKFQDHTHDAIIK